MQGSEELFSIEPLPARSPAVDTVTHVVGASASNTAVPGYISQPHTPIPSSSRVELAHLGGSGVERLVEELVGGDAEVSSCCIYGFCG
jgi:hypothetical protein